MSKPAWWQRGAIYQIYPRSFADGDGDGVGDLRGILEHLDYLSALRVEAVWLSPICPSPKADFGYDVADYCDVDPVFGTLGDLDELIAGCHAHGIAVVLDWVPNHTSDRHPWFAASRSRRDDPKRDWYVWRDGKPGGRPPNDWRSSFEAAGDAWTFGKTTGQWYLHSFLPQQPDLQLGEPASRGGDARRAALLAGQGRRRVPHRRRPPDRQGPAPARQRRRPAGRGLGNDSRATPPHPSHRRRAPGPDARRGGLPAGPAPGGQLRLERRPAPPGAQLLLSAPAMERRGGPQLDRGLRAVGPGRVAGVVPVQPRPRARGQPLRRRRAWAGPGAGGRVDAPAHSASWRRAPTSWPGYARTTATGCSQPSTSGPSRPPSRFEASGAGARPWSSPPTRAGATTTWTWTRSRSGRARACS